MRLKPVLQFVGAALLGVQGGPALGQEAAEAAQVLAGVSGQGRAARSLGDAISGSIERATGGIGATPRARGRSRARGAPREVQGATLPRGGNDLKDTDAASYRTGGQATISVSGRFRSAPGTSCVENCEGEAGVASPAN